ncbi:MAG: DinB family protein [Flavobacteriales bacterium]
MKLQVTHQMIELTRNLEYLVLEVSKYVSETSDEILSGKTNPEKWSKKEILGHLIDSGINNLQRFTEIQFAERPYKLVSYNQNELVKANQYQIADSGEILDLLQAINRRIIQVVKSLPEKFLEYKIVADNGTSFNLIFLIEDYVNHFEHHAKQIVE